MKLRSRTVAAVAAALLVAACGGPSEDEMLSSARTAIEAKDHRSAVIQLKSLLQKNGNHGEGRFLLGRSLLEQGDAGAALVELRKAADLKYEPTKVTPLLARAMLAQGEHAAVIGQFSGIKLPDAQAQADLAVVVATAFLAQKDAPAAELTLADALTAVPTHVPARLLKARVLADQQQTDEARKIVEAVLTENPKSADGWMLKGELALNVDKDRKAAIEAFRKAVTEEPTLLQAHIAAVTTLFLEGDAEGAKTQVAEMKKRFANHPRTRFFEAELAYNAKDYKAAREHIQPVVQALPSNALALQLAGAADFRLGNLAQAETFLGKALQVAPELPIARRMLAQVYLRTGQPQKALSTLEPVLTRNPGPAALQLAAEAHLQSGEPQKAEQLFERAAKLKPDDPRIRTALALSQFGKGKADSAINELEDIASSDKGALADLALVSAHLRRKEIDKALQAIDALEKKQPDQPLAPMMRGRVLVLKQDIEGARAQFQKALAIDKLYFPAAAGLAALDVAANKVPEARKHLDDLLKADPNNLPAKQALAALLTRTGNTGDEVAKLLSDAVKQNPNDVRAQLMLINFHLERRDAKLAVAAAREASQVLVDHPDILMVLGRAYLAADDTQQAVTTFNRLAVTQPKSPQAHLGLADAHLALKDRTAASRSLKRALELEPRLLQARRGLVAIALADNKPAEALEMARAVQKDLPNDAVGHVLEGDVEAFRKDLKAALAAYQRALAKANPQEAATRTHNTMIALGQATEAEQFAQRWIGQNPKDAMFPFYLADRALAARDYATAESRYRKVIELQPNNALALNNVAWLMVQQSKTGAVTYAEKANQLLPGRPPLMDTLASALAAEKQVPRALEVQKQAVDRAPEDGSLRMNLAKLYLQSNQKGMARTELERLERMGRKYPNQDEVDKMLKAL
ncbi:XrtA/PEP-CTERM system TPR-repeat protein PrsT [Pseudorhodoferax sp.]|uniref:XrtA/PEP-CTERM system TPR-repeat protein PrsT n=1 Tax=Pseudorhodoferax sp. TaxID=1993553 RepID=UPI002DD6522F|nr:XrtA/PEP-CTERM system TPR-repeat protein PrsT [Pseudorhodoferax sp.]